MWRYIFIAVWLFSIVSFESSGQNTEMNLKEIVRNGKVAVLTEALETDPGIKQEVFHYAIRIGKYDICNNMLRSEINLNQRYEKTTPLINAVRNNHKELVELFLTHGARINFPDEKGNTALMYAVAKGDIEMVKIIVEAGADCDVQNLHGRTVHDFLPNMEKNPVLNYCNDMNVLTKISLSLPDMREGPHIFFEQQDQVARVEYYTYDSALNQYFKKYRRFPVIDGTLRFKGFEGDTNRYVLQTRIDNEPVHTDCSGKLFAIGDVHGNMEALKSLLKSQSIIDTNGNWIFGSGQLVFTGDIFDRGSQVTEVLWFIHQLYQQAKKAGGYVHLLLGNHEIMALTGDHRYLHSHYIKLMRFLRLPYYQWFNEDSYMGRWLRSRNVVITIGDKMFLHAGISPRVLKLKITAATINDVFRLHLYNKKYIPDNVHKLLVSGDGPVWYRGYISPFSNYTEIDTDILKATLDFYQVDKIIVGHTENFTIQPLFGHKVYVIDVPLGRSNYLAQGLLILEDGFYKCSENGKCVKIE
jgi:hypothetical protein